MSYSRRDFIATGTGFVLASVRGTGFAGERWALPPKRPFREIENVWITMKDGVRIGVRLWLPDDADHLPVPAILESIPYGKRVRLRTRRAAWAAAIVPYRFAYAVADLRGSGESGGVLLDEYLPREQDDNLQIIAWLAKQPWCNGAVGMRGVSWGGFSALQAAARRPPALKAIITQCASDNRYTDDAHYIGGSLAMDGGEWSGDFALWKALPPDPQIVGEQVWRDMWMQRLNAATPVMADWLSHQRYDRFWRQGSVAVDYSRIKCPVYAVDGQTDPYRDFVGRLLTNLKVPRKGLIGPWGHHPPHVASPGPGLDWATEEVLWWSQWLRGENTGIMDEPGFRAYVQYETASKAWPQDVPGRWIAERHSPSDSIRYQTFFLNEDGLGRTAKEAATRTCRSRETLGLTIREWYIVNPRIDLPKEQTPDDRMSVLFDSEPLEENLEFVGNPLVRVRLSSDQPVAKLAVRINEVTPDGRSWNVSYGVLNLTHRDGHTHPAPLQIGKAHDVEVSCYYAAHRFNKGSRMRVALSESLWPLVWPSPRPVTLRIVTGASYVLLPVRQVEIAAAAPSVDVLPGRVVPEHSHPASENDGSAEVFQTGPDAAGRVSIHKKLRDGVTVIPGINVTINGGTDWYLSIVEGDPNSCVWRFDWFRTTRRGSWDTTVRSSVEISSTTEEFRVRESLEATERDQVTFRRAWDNRRRRDLA